MASRFVRPETKTLPISHGDTLTVRKRLTAGERRAMFARMYAEGTVRVDPIRVGVAAMTAYLLDWTLTDDDGKPVPIRDLSPDDIGRVLDNLTPESFNEIQDAIETHAEAMDAERVTEKNDQATESMSSATSPFVVPSTGDTTGSLRSRLTSTTF